MRVAVWTPRQRCVMYLTKSALPVGVNRRGVRAPYPARWGVEADLTPK